MAAYRWVHDSRHLQADCQAPGSAPEPYARQSSMGYLYLFHSHRMQSRVYVTVGRPSVCPIVCPLHSAAAGLLLWAQRAGDIDRLLHGRRSAANASSVTFTADVGG